MTRLAILDDYQHVALESADWASLKGVEMTTFHDHLADDDAVVARLAEFDVVVAMRERTPFTAERLRRLPRLRLLVTTGMANAAIDMDHAREAGIVVAGTGYDGAATSELTWALILAVTRNVVAEDRAIREGRWQHTIGPELAGRTLGVIGLGDQGRRVATIGIAFGMTVVAWSSNLEPSVARSHGVTPVRKEELLATADIVSVHVRLSGRTRGLIGAAELRLMRPTAFLINTSRGPVVDQCALLESLRTGAIAGAALDVFDEEPLPPDHALRKAPRTVLTPHIGYVAKRAYERFYGDAVEDVAAYLAGEPVRVLNA